MSFLNYILPYNEEKLLYSGKIKFPGLKVKLAEYICVEADIDPRQVVDYMYSSDKWNMRKHELILSVTGGTKRFSISSRMRKSFKYGLMKAAQSTDSVILTNGRNKLVGEAIEENRKNKNKIDVVGILPSHVVACREKLEVDKSQKKIVLYGLVNTDSKASDSFLDQNHSHFIIIYNCRPGEDIKFRLELEDELRRRLHSRDDLINQFSTQNERRCGSLMSSQASSCDDDELRSHKSLKIKQFNEHEVFFKSHHDIPLIHLYVHGGYEMLTYCQKALIKKIPILIFNGSNGCADLIADVVGLNESNDELIGKLIEESMLLVKSKYQAKYKDSFSECLEILKSILEMKIDLVNIFNLDNDSENNEDIEYMILKAFLDSQKNNSFDILKLALQWNRIDVVIKNDVFSGNEILSAKQLEKLLEIAMVENKPEFVQLLLENGTNLSSFLTYGRLYYLYNSKQILSQSKVLSAPLYEVYRSKTVSDDEKKITFITFKKVKNFLKKFTNEELTYKFLPIDAHHCLSENEDILDKIKDYLDEYYFKENTSIFLIDEQNNIVETDIFEQKVKNATQNMFFWALLLNRIEIAKIFWQMSYMPIGNGLVASVLYSTLNNELQDNKNLEKISIEFTEMSVGVLTLLDKSSIDDSINYENLSKFNQLLGQSNLQIAVSGNVREFVGNSCVQNYITKTWNGRIQMKSNFTSIAKLAFSIISLGTLAPFLAFNSNSSFLMENLNEDYDQDNILDVLTISNRIDRRKSNKKNQLNPLLDQLDNQSKTLDVKQKDVKKDSGRKNLLKRTKVTYKSYSVRYLEFMSSPRIIFCYDTFSFICFLFAYSYFIMSEFRFKTIETMIDLTYDLKNLSNKTQTFDSIDYNQTKIVQNEFINKPSILEYVLIVWIFSFVVEEIRQFVSDDTKIPVKIKLIRYFRGILSKLFKFLSSDRIIFCLAFVIWCIRLLHVTLLFRSLGPKVVMIEKMVKDLVFFMIIMIIFVFAFGITTHATLYPEQKEFNWNIFYTVINNAYWSIYGTIQLIDNLDVECDPRINSKCPTKSGIIYSYIFLMAYVILGNVLLINLLIAMFSSTFQQVQENADLIWKFNRYKLVYEYVGVPILPPPLSLLSYLTYYLMKICRSSKNDSNDSFEDSDVSYEELERKYAQQYLEMKRNEKKETNEVRLKWSCEKIELLEAKLNTIIEMLSKPTKKK